MSVDKLPLNWLIKIITIILFTIGTTSSIIFTFQTKAEAVILESKLKIQINNNSNLIKIAKQDLNMVKTELAKELRGMRKEMRQDFRKVIDLMSKK